MRTFFEKRFAKLNLPFLYIWATITLLLIGVQSFESGSLNTANEIPKAPRKASEDEQCECFRLVDFPEVAKKDCIICSRELELKRKDSNPKPAPAVTYLYKRTLSRGNLFVTRLVENSLTKTTCIQKKITPNKRDFDRYSRALSILNREWDILSVLKHDCIIEEIEHKSDSKNQHSIYKFVEGIELFTFLDDFFRLGEAESDGQLEDEYNTIIKQIFLDLVNVIQFLQSNMLMHHDIKPENIILSKESGKPVLIDFEMVRNFVDDFPYIGRGTQGYVPREQFEEYANPDIFVDYFSLGATLFVMVFRDSPDAMHSPQKKLEIDVPEDSAADLIQRLCHKEREIRLIDASAILEHPFIANEAKQTLEEKQNVRQLIKEKIELMNERTKAESQ